MAFITLVLLAFDFHMILWRSQSYEEPFFAGRAERNKSLTGKPDNVLPFADLFLEYILSTTLTISLDNFVLTLPILANFTLIFYSSASVPLNYRDLGYSYVMRAETSLLFEGVEYRENMTFYLDTKNRIFTLDQNRIEGSRFVPYISLVYDNSQNVINYNPFWINSKNISVGSEYEIFSFPFNVTGLFQADFGNIAGLKEVYILKTNQKVRREDQAVNASHDITALYDVFSGVLIKGRIESKFDFDNNTNKNYILDFNLNNTNAFAAFPPDPSKNQTLSTFVGLLPNFPPNVPLLIAVFFAPLILVLFHILRIRKIDGGI